MIICRSKNIEGFAEYMNGIPIRQFFNARQAFRQRSAETTAACFQDFIFLAEPPYLKFHAGDLTKCNCHLAVGTDVHPVEFEKIVNGTARNSEAAHDLANRYVLRI